MMRAIRRLDCVGCESLCWIVVIVRELVPDWPESDADIGAGTRLAVCDAGIRLASWLVVNVMQVSELVADTSSSDAGIRACSRLASWLEVLDAGIRAISRDLATVPLYQFQPPLGPTFTKREAISVKFTKRTI